jgi:hypothetical protein
VVATASAIQSLAEPRDLGRHTLFERGGHFANELSIGGERHAQRAPRRAARSRQRAQAGHEHSLTGGHVPIAVA